MRQNGMTTMAVRQINRGRVYAAVYRAKSVSKLQIVQQLGMSLSTVSQNLQALEDDGLILREGYFESTGGRKSQAIRIDRTARVAIGLGILKDCLHIVAVDLYGEVINAVLLPVPYRQCTQYYERVGAEVKQFIAGQEFDEGAVLGVSIAVQGIISPDGERVNYGAIMHNGEMRLEDFARNIPYRCRLEHDSKAAGFLEMWNHPDVNSAAVFLLNGNLGGALILNRRLYRGEHMQGGIIEHICVEPAGARCYCGRRGCLENYCSADALRQQAGMEIPQFFEKMRGGDAECGRLWCGYIAHLAAAVRTVNTIIDGDIIISGYLAPYFTAGDVAALCGAINDSNSFLLEPERIILGERGQYTQAIGAALFYIQEFIESMSQ